MRHGREGGQPYPAPRVVGLNRNAVDCAPKAGRGCLLAVLGNMNKRLNLSAAWKALDDHLCEGNRAPAGVRFPPKQEAAGLGC
ncbi:hypothetical protein SPHINGOT1_490059 [Sphingomonas sp. T1]|nr:hypothetical protein SPHINGOT1_490059 [Sphingomonas sp. T1]